MHLHLTPPFFGMFPNTHLFKCRNVKPLWCFAPTDVVTSSLRPPSSCVQCGGNDVPGSCGTVPKFFWGKEKLLQSFTQQLTPQLPLALI